jgi:3-hydroxyisobutyrate dehydrogenase
MGYSMAGNIRNTGRHDLTVYNRTAAKAEAWVRAFGGSTAATPAAASGADFPFCCVGNDNDLREVTLAENGASPGHQEGSGSSTTPPPRQHRAR